MMCDPWEDGGKKRDEKEEIHATPHHKKNKNAIDILVYS